jgi:hypothetical protein
LKNVLKASLLLAGALVLAACSSPERGTVMDKSHSAGYMMMTCGSYSAQGICTSQISTWIPDAWYLELEDCSVDPCQTGSRSVSEDVYDVTAVGSYFEPPSE